MNNVSHLSSVMSVGRAFGFGAVGGLVCYSVGVPAPWLAGSLLGTIAAVYSRQDLNLPDWIRAAAFILLGVQTGNSVNEDTVARAAQWPLSICCLAATVTLIVWACTYYYEHWRKWDRPTALFASLPGALSLVMLLASTTRADMRRVTISQCVRLFFLIAALPAVVKLTSPLPLTGTHAVLMSDVWEIVVLVLASAGAGLVFAALKIPAGLILGASLMSAILGLSGIVHGLAPNSILVPANIVLGVMIGLRFKGVSFTELMAEFTDGVAGFVIAMVIATIGAYLTSVVAGLPFSLTLLAFAPGGLEAMTIMAFALNLDPAYVAAHQVARYIGMVLLMPAVTGFLLNRAIVIKDETRVELD